MCKGRVYEVRGLRSRFIKSLAVGLGNFVAIVHFVLQGQETLIIVQEIVVMLIEIGIAQEIQSLSEPAVRREFYELMSGINITYLFCDKGKNSAKYCQHPTEFEVDVLLSPRSVGIVASEFVVEAQCAPISQ